MTATRYSQTLPEGYVPWQQWPEHDFLADLAPLVHGVMLPGTPRGARWGIWPLYIEGYTCDQEPNIDAAAKLFNPPPRIVLWNRITRTDIPVGWRRMPGQGPSKFGVADLRNSGDDYWAHWSESARRYRRHWLRLRDSTYRVEKIPYDTFVDAYKQSIVYKRAGKDRLLDLMRQYDASAQHITLYGVRRITDNKIVAGFATLTSPTYKSSYYIAGFFLSEAGDDPVVLGLIDTWHQEAKQQGLHFLDFGIFWQPGNPRAWKGFSQFKMQFCTHSATLPPTLWRLMPGRLWRW